jgi:predicted Zn-dependent protease
MKKPAFVLLMALTALLAACGTKSQNPVTGREERVAMSESQEVVEGRKAHQEVLKEYKSLDNPALQKYVNDIGQQLALSSHRASITWTFTVLDSPEVNAFALPGGYVYITRGIMAYLNDEADLAGVLGHEIGHVTARHGAQRAQRGQNAQLGAMAGVLLGAVLGAKGYGQLGDAASQVSQMAAARYVAKYSQSQELQADGLGAEYLSRVRYDVRNMVDVIRVLKDQDQFQSDLAREQGRPAPQGNAWLASHPTSDQRLDAIMKLSAQYKAAATAQDDGRNRFMQVMRGVAFGETADQGLTRGQNFYHESLGFVMTAPTGWRIVNSDDELLFVAPNGEAALVMQPVPQKAGTTHDQILRSYVGAQGGDVRRGSLDGMPATRFEGTRRDERGQASRIECTVVTLPSGLNVLLADAGRDANALARQRGGLRQVEASMRRFGPADKAAALPWKVQTVPMPAGGFAELARVSPLARAEQQLRLINGVYSLPAGNDPRPGALVKIVSP